MVPLSSSAERLAYVDALRGLAVVLMAEQHLGVWLTAVHRVRGGLLPWVMGFNALGGAAAPLFVFLAGVSMARASHLPGIVLVRRALALGLCGYALNLACPSWFSPGSFYVLHLIATFWLLVPGLRRLGEVPLLAGFALVLAATLAAQTWLGTPPLLDSQRLRDTTLPLGAVRLALAEGHFPVLPWLAFGLLGLFAGRLVGLDRTRGLLSAALVLLALLIMLRLPRLWLPPGRLRGLPLRSLIDVSFYPASIAFVLLLAGICLLLLLAARTWVGKVPLGAHWLVALGRTSLTFLCVHVVVFREGSRALGLYQRVSPVAVLAIMVAVLAAWVLLARAWAKSDYRYSLEWWLRLAGGGRRRGEKPAQDLPR